MNRITPFFTEMEDYIRDCREKLAQGKDFDMLGLDIKIESLCNMVLELPAEDRGFYEPRLQGLLENLNSLGNELKDHMNATVPSHKRASVAYKTADSRDNFGKRDEKK